VPPVVLARSPIRVAPAVRGEHRGDDKLFARRRVADPASLPGVIRAVAPRIVASLVPDGPLQPSPRRRGGDARRPPRASSSGPRRRRRRSGRGVERPRLASHARRATNGERAGVFGVGPDHPEAREGLRRPGRGRHPPSLIAAARRVAARGGSGGPGADGRSGRRRHPARGGAGGRSAGAGARAAACAPRAAGPGEVEGRVRVRARDGRSGPCGRRSSPGGSGGGRRPDAAGFRSGERPPGPGPPAVSGPVRKRVLEGFRSRRRSRPSTERSRSWGAASDPQAHAGRPSRERPSRRRRSVRSYKPPRTPGTTPLAATCRSR
jgi:hypothetical protein